MDGMAPAGLAAQKDELAFDDGIELLDDEDLVNAFEEFRGELLGEGVGGGNLHDRKRKPRHVEGFHDVAVAHAAAGDAEGQLAAALFPGADCLLVAGTAHLDAVVTVARLCQMLCNLRRAMLDLAVVEIARAREDDPALGVLHEARGLVRTPARIVVRSVGVCKLRAAIGDATARLDRAAGVAHARGRSQEDGRVVFLRQLEGILHHAIGLAWRGGVEHGDLGEAPESAGVLLGLARDGAGVVGDHDDEPAFDAQVRQRHKRVGCDVETDLLHRDQRARARIGGARRCLEGGLLVCRPFDVDRSVAVVLGHRLENLRRGGPGVAADKVHAGVNGAQADCLVAHQ